MNIFFIIILILLIFFTYGFGFMLFISSFGLFAQAQLQISAQEVGFYMMWVGFTRVLFQSFLIDPLLKKINEDLKEQEKNLPPLLETIDKHERGFKKA